MAELTEFHPFPRLPTELRLKIWSLVHPSSREVQITCQKAITSAFQPRRYATSFTSNTLPPVTCHICPESRAEALEIYKPLFRTTRSECRTYISFAKDTISMADKDIQYLGTEERDGIQMMKVKVIDCSNFGHYHMNTFKGLKSLKELEVVMDERVGLQQRNFRDQNPAIALIWQFEDERREDPAWECPRVRIVGSDTGKLYGESQGGALIPGWKIGDEVPDGA